MPVLFKGFPEKIKVSAAVSLDVSFDIQMRIKTHTKVISLGLNVLCQGF